MKKQIIINFGNTQHAQATVEGACTAIRCTSNVYQDKGIQEGDIVFLSEDYTPLAIMRDIFGSDPLDLSLMQQEPQEGKE